MSDERPYDQGDDDAAEVETTTTETTETTTTETADGDERLEREGDRIDDENADDNEHSHERREPEGDPNP